MRWIRRKRRPVVEGARCALNLDEEPAAEVVVVDGERYVLLDLRGASLREQARARRLHGRIAALEHKDEPSEGDEARLDEAVGETVRLALPGLPEEVFDRLDRYHRHAVARAFIERVEAYVFARELAALGSLSESYTTAERAEA